MASSQTSFRLATINRYTIIMLVCWTLVVVGSFFWNVRDARNQTLAPAKKEALITFYKDQTFRYWVAKHGGVYVPVTE